MKTDAEHRYPRHHFPRFALEQKRSLKLPIKMKKNIILLLATFSVLACNNTKQQGSKHESEEIQSSQSIELEKADDISKNDQRG